MNLGFGGEDDDGQYHSIYDSYDLYKRFKDPTFEYGVALAKVAGRTTLRFANAETLPFDFRNLQKTISKYVTEVISLSDNMRENTAVENQLIKDKYYALANNVTAPLLPPAAKAEVPFLNFASLQNAVTALEKATNSLNDAITRVDVPAAKKEALNQKLYKAEQTLLTKDGLPRRGWYRHAIYAPGFYTGYGVKTLPGIREAIEQRDFKEAQEQIEVAAGAINQLTAYLNDAAKGL
jgi:N-acetylated-alpha-linked acidic dipeptidase